MSLVQFAETELRAAGYFEGDKEYGAMLAHAVMDLIKLLAEQGHSGGSIGPTLSIFNRLARYQPLTPLTGEDGEWADIGEGQFQNKRCSTVFKNAVDGAYNIDGKIFRLPNGSCYTNRDSRSHITFPYTPKSEYVDVVE